MKNDSEYRESVLRRFPNGIPNSVQPSVRMLMAYFFPDIEYYASVDHLKHSYYIQVNGIDPETVQEKLVSKMPACFGINVSSMDIHQHSHLLKGE